MITAAEYAEIKAANVKSILAKICADDPPDIRERAEEFAKENGITDPITIAQLGWMLMGERRATELRMKRRPKR